MPLLLNAAVEIVAMCLLFIEAEAVSSGLFISFSILIFKLYESKFAADLDRLSSVFSINFLALLT